MQTPPPIVTVSAVGLDAPGLVARITTKIFELGGNIIDVEENCRRGLFSIFLIVDFAGSANDPAENVAALEALGPLTGLKIGVGQHSAETERFSLQPEHHLVTVIGNDRPGIIAKVSTFFHRRNINIETCRMMARGQFFSMEMTIDTSKMAVATPVTRQAALDRMKAELKALCAGIDQSVVIQSNNVHLRAKKLIVFDVEAALVRADTLASFLSQIRGRLDAGERVGDDPDARADQMQMLVDNARRLAGIPAVEFARLSRSLQVYPGSFELIRILKSMGFKVALISSGFHFFMKTLFRSVGVDYAFSNTLKTDADGITTGELEEPIITNRTKGRILDLILDMEGLDREQVIAVGDGSSSTHAIDNVGLSIAFKPGTEETRADGVLSDDRILTLLYCLGIPQTELDKYL